MTDDCPVDVVQPGGTTCRTSTGPCDVVEHCDGALADCPADAVEPSSTVCRPAAGVCDVAEHCDGATVNCPTDGAGGSEVVCRPAAGACDVAECCDGSGTDCPPDVVMPASTTCRPSAGDCDLPDGCDGVGSGCPADAKSTAVCRASAGPCDIAETCDGVGNDCQTDVFQPATTVCRESAGDCDVEETCTGSSAGCPLDTDLPDTDGDSVCDAIANPGQANGDSDPLGDACDPCTNSIPTVPSKTKLIFSKLLAPTGDDKLNFKGFFTAVPTSPTINPVANGLRVLVTDSTGILSIDATIPGGAYGAVNRVGWKVNGSGTAWKYSNAGSGVPVGSGIYKAQLKAYASTPGKYKFAVKGKNGNYVVNTANLPLTGTLVIDVPYAATGQCGETTFLLPPNKPSCSVAGGGKTVKCK